jgi:hypothetical protein
MPPFNANGYLPPGKWSMSWRDFRTDYGFNNCRVHLLSGFRILLILLAESECSTVYVGGSFVTNRSVPNGIDGCFDVMTTKFAQLDPIFQNPDQQYDRFGCRLRMDWMSQILGFFQSNHDGEPVGVVELSFNRNDLDLIR